MNSGNTVAIGLQNDDSLKNEDNLKMKVTSKKHDLLNEIEDNLKNDDNQKIEINLKREANLKMKTILFSKEKNCSKWLPSLGENTLKKD